MRQLRHCFGGIYYEHRTIRNPSMQRVGTCTILTANVLHMSCPYCHKATREREVPRISFFFFFDEIISAHATHPYMSHHPRRVTCCAKRPCLSGADWCLQSDAVNQSTHPRPAVDGPCLARWAAQDRPHLPYNDIDIYSDPPFFYRFHQRRHHRRHPRRHQRRHHRAVPWRAVSITLPNISC